MIVVLDYGIGNIKSITGSLEHLNEGYKLTSDLSDIRSSEGLIIPGVGAFKHGMKLLKEKGLVEEVQRFRDSEKPILGICLGMQLLFEKSYEFGETEGLGLINGSVRKLESESKEITKLPFVSWNGIKKYTETSWKNTILDSIEDNSEMYFVHSYYGDTEESNILAYAEYYGKKYCAAVKKDNVYGCQFHPEKSGFEGIKIIQNFVKICKDS